MQQKRKAGRPAKVVDPTAVRHLKEEGFSFRAIARQLGCGYGSARRAFRGIPTTSKTLLCEDVASAYTSRGSSASTTRD